MIIQNVSSIPVLAMFNGTEIVLTAGETREISCLGKMNLVLKHTYGSSALSMQEISKDLSGDSLIGLMLSSYHDPYFKIALVSDYSIVCSETTLIKIQRQKLRPSYSCFYDRLTIQILEGKVLYEKYDFDEKEQFKLLYNQALYHSHRSARVFEKILGFCATLTFLLLIYLSIKVGILGFIGGGLLLGLFLIPLIIIKVIVKATTKVDGNMVFSDFESDKIIKYFCEKEQEIEFD